MRKATNHREHQMKIFYGRASLVVSFVGIAVGAVTLTLILSFARGWSQNNTETRTRTTTMPPVVMATTSPTTPVIPRCPFRFGSVCYQFESTFSAAECVAIVGVIGRDENTMRLVCYHNTCSDYSVNNMCFKYRSVGQASV